MHEEVLDKVFHFCPFYKYGSIAAERGIVLREQGLECCLVPCADELRFPYVRNVFQLCGYSARGRVVLSLQI